MIRSALHGLHWMLCGLIVLSTGLSCASEPTDLDDMSATTTNRISLPTPNTTGSMPLEQAVHQRRSIRSFADQPITLEQLSQLAWAAQGITDQRRNYRASPSAGATYPLELLFVIGNADEMEPGVYRYKPADHSLTLELSGDHRTPLAQAALGQSFIAEAPMVLVYAGVLARTAQRYGDRAGRYVWMEVGHAAQNVSLQAVALNLGSVVVGAFHDDAVADLLNLPNGERPLYIQPVGQPTTVP